MVKLGQKFYLKEGYYGKITEVFCLGFNFHTIDSNGNCTKGQQYKLKSDLTTLDNKGE